VKRFEIQCETQLKRLRKGNGRWIKNLALARLVMEAKEYVDTAEYCRSLEKYGFKYNPMNKTLFLGYPYVPKEFRDEAVKIQLFSPVVSSVAEIRTIEFMRANSPYKATEEPKEGFRKYVENILKAGSEAAQPKTIIV
jgi:hypothetical protein